MSSDSIAKLGLAAFELTLRDSPKETLVLTLEVTPVVVDDVGEMEEFRGLDMVTISF